MNRLYFTLLMAGILATAMIQAVSAEPAADRFPSGAETPEGAACDLLRAFIRSDVDLLKATCIKRYPPAQQKFDQFLAMIIRGTEEDKQRGAPHPKNPAQIVKLFAARKLSTDGPASYGFAVLKLQDVMFVDVLAQLHDGSFFMNRTMVVKTEKGAWRVHPCPTIDSLLSAGLNEESDSTVEFVPPKKAAHKQATPVNTTNALSPSTEPKAGRA